MNLDFNPSRWQAVHENYRRWWAGTLGRPLAHLTVTGRDPGRPEPAIPAHEFTSFHDMNVPASAIADRWLYDLESRYFIGDAFPQVRPNFGAGVPAGFMGLELQNGNGTVWFHQPNDVELPDLEFRFDPGNMWYRRVCDIYQAAADRFGDMIQLGMTDLGGSLDILASFRQPENLAMDLYDDPAMVERKVWEIHHVWWRYFHELDGLVQRAHPGYTAWAPIYSETPYYMLQSDFSYMIGNDMFQRFVLPDLTATCQRLGNAYYHLDGPGELPHLDSLLAIPELKGIQWIPGAGQAPITEWPDIYRRIRAAGKTAQFFTEHDPLGWRALEVIADQLGSADGLMIIGDVPPAERDEAIAMLARFGIV